VSTLEAPPRFRFDLSPELEAREPAEARGLDRDHVRLLVAYRGDGRLVHARFHDLPDFLHPGDLLVINTSRTLPAALPTLAPDGRALRLHLSTRMGPALWTVELRRPAGNASEPFGEGRPGWRLSLPEGAWASLRWPADTRATDGDVARHRLWAAEICTPVDVLEYLARSGEPIRYGYASGPWPLSAYQTAFGTEPGSAEMPSAGRGFTPELVTRLVARGVLFAPLVLHTGVSSLEEGEDPYPEWFHLPPTTAQLVNATRDWGGRVIAVGTTVVRALESAAGGDGRVVEAQGCTDLVVTPRRGVRTVDGLITGWHRPEASHLQMLEAIAGRDLLEASYREALARGYLWHEFGDEHLILP
jgi:S-adenosylmethionine:tRNA ribosyltransferase-isomerase